MKKNPRERQQQGKVLVTFRLSLLKCGLITSVLCSVCACMNTEREAEADSTNVNVSAESWWYNDPFNDHTAKQILNRSDFQRFAKHNDDMQVLKFLLSEPQSGQSEGWSEKAQIRYYDSHFYTLHDQLYWFRLLNGSFVWSFDTEPLDPPLSLDNVEAIIQEMKDWQAEGKSLPLDLKFTAGKRLYAPHFYEEILTHPRRSIAGSIIHIDPHPDRNNGEEIWAFELEYSDEPTVNEIMSLLTYFEKHLPQEMKELNWLTRSPYQSELADQIIAQNPAYQNSMINYNDLVVVGEASVYSEGITAGRLHLLEDVQEPTQEREILIYQNLPDELPACRALVSTIPQTPLAHLNLLARNRGIANLYVGGLGQNPSISQLSRVRAPVLLWAQSPSNWQLVPLKQDEYQRYINLKTKPERDLSRPVTEESPYWLDYNNLSIDELLEFRPLIGGKASGVLIINKIIDDIKSNPQGTSDLSNELETISISPPQPLFTLTGRAYAEHLAGIENTLRPLLNNSELINQRSRLILLLEGWQGIWLRDFDYEVHESLRAWLEQEGEQTQSLILGGGLQAWIRNTAINQQLLRGLTEQLRLRFAELSPYQGLRFRSSSNIEDLDGFNGAGLYSSFTAYLYPQHQSDPNQQTKTIARALKALWASYWNIEAFKERELEGIEHFSGWMGALIHPNFQNSLELSNGVMTLTLMTTPQARGHLFADQDLDPKLIALVTLNSQLGSESVTNPSSQELLTEVIEVRIYKDSLHTEPRLEVNYLQASSLSPEVLSREYIRQLSLTALEITEAWRQSDNRSLDSSQRYQAFTLDFEYRQMDQTWPLKRGQNDSPLTNNSRMILKQVRPLEPSMPNLTPQLQSTAFPLDLQKRSLRIQRWSCQSRNVELSVLQLYSDPLSGPDMGFHNFPFTGEISYTDHRAEARNPSLAYRLSHRDYLVLQSSHRTEEKSQAWHLELYRRVGRNLPFEHLKVDQKQGMIMWTPRNQDGTILNSLEESVHCESEILFANPKDYLLSLKEQARLDGRGFGNE